MQGSARKDVVFGQRGCILSPYQGQNGNPGPDDQQRPVDVADQSLQEVDDLELADRTTIEPEVKVAQRQPGRHRKLLPVEVELQRCLAARRPGATAMRLLTQSAFVDEDDRAALFLGFFLVAGQVLRCQ